MFLGGQLRLDDPYPVEEPLDDPEAAPAEPLPLDPPPEVVEAPLIVPEE